MANIILNRKEKYLIMNIGYTSKRIKLKKIYYAYNRLNRTGKKNAPSYRIVFDKKNCFT